MVAAHIIDMLAYGQLTIGDFKPPEQFPSYDAVMDMAAEMMDRLLTPEDGGNSEAGKQVLCQIVVATKAHLEQIKQAKSKQTIL